MFRRNESYPLEVCLGGWAGASTMRMGRLSMLTRFAAEPSARISFRAKFVLNPFIFISNGASTKS